MRKVFDLIIFFLFLSILFWQKDRIISIYNQLLSSPCDQPITYKLGEVDSGYGLTNDQFLQRISEADQIWDKVVNKNLFAYKSDGQITINLIYSDTQSIADKLGSLQNNLKSGKTSLDSSISQYQSLQADFQKKLQTFNAEVENWNKLGGAPQEVFNQLKTQQDELKAEADQLNQMAASLNLSAQNYNLKVGQYNQSAQNFKQAINANPEAGVYNGSLAQIDIYLTNSQKELVHTLAHEMGHALRLPHLDNPQAIMYPYSSEVTKPAPEETAQLQAFCGQKNYNLAFSNLRILLSKQSKQ